MFQPNNFEEGKNQVVGNCNDILMDERWKEETPIFRDIILQGLPETCKTVLDYGCGVGRLAKEVLEANRQIKVIGVDSSKGMLKEAKNYVLSDRFTTKTVEEFNEKVDFAYCVYVFQHIPALELRDAIRQVAESTDRMLLVNSIVRMAVSGGGFVNDGVSVLDEVARYFTKFRSAIPFGHIVNNQVMRKMFLEGNTLHYAVLCEK